jgi:hypothetical protein
MLSANTGMDVRTNLTAWYSPKVRLQIHGIYHHDILAEPLSTVTRITGLKSMVRFDLFIPCHQSPSTFRHPCEFWNGVKIAK